MPVYRRCGYGVLYLNVALGNKSIHLYEKKKNMYMFFYDFCIRVLP